MVSKIKFTLTALVLLIFFSIALIFILLIFLPTTDDCTNPSVRFAAIGDYGDDTPAEADVAALVKSWNPDFIITTGDNNYPNGQAETIDKNVGKHYQEFIGNYTGIYGAGATRNNFYPTVGNHDLLDWGDPNPFLPYTDYFTLPKSSSGNERYYDFKHGPIHFFALNSCWQEPDGNTNDSVQARWFETNLKNSTSPWKLVYMHHHPRTSWPRTDKPGTEWPFQALGATAVLVGEDHFYERIVDDNFPFFVNGLGGREDIHNDFPDPPTKGTQFRYNADYGAMLIESSESCINFKFINRSGQLIDNYTIDKSLGGKVKDFIKRFKILIAKKI